MTELKNEFFWSKTRDEVFGPASVNSAMKQDMDIRLISLDPMITFKVRTVDT